MTNKWEPGLLYWLRWLSGKGKEGEERGKFGYALCSLSECSCKKCDCQIPSPTFDIVENKAIFNYRLSRARRVNENSFGILAARWRIFRRPILAEPDRAVCYTKAAIALHNYLRTEESSVYCPPGFVDAEDGTGNAIGGSWRHSDQESSYWTH